MEFAEFVGKGVAGFVLSTFAASEGHQQRLHALAAGFICEQAAIFVIRMRSGMHEARRCIQPSQHLFQPGDAGVPAVSVTVGPPETFPSSAN